MRSDRGASKSDQIATFAMDGHVRTAARNLAAPNGMAISPDGCTLVLAATWRHELVSMTVHAGGSLTSPRARAVPADLTPDGICMDAEGGIWLGGLAAGRFVRVASDGRITDEIAVGDRWAVACVLGGADRMTLFMTVAKTRWPVDSETRGYLLAAEVDIPGTGWP